MFRLRTGYLISGIITGCILLFSFVGSLPDGKLHIIFCDVGQGDAAYIRFPDGRDMVIDGGPNDQILGCLGKYMPFWDRYIDMVLMTHPQKDHMQGLISVFERYTVGYFVRSDIENSTEGYQKLLAAVEKRSVPVKYMSRGENIDIGGSLLTFIWPSVDQIAKGDSNILGASIGDLNDYSLVFGLRYGTFDTLFTGDADIRVEGNYTGDKLADEQVEVLKVPHHGSKTGMNEAFIHWIRPKLAVISVGKNNYGHPSSEAISFLQDVGAKILRTDQEGNIEVVSDGLDWKIEH